jgi:hypothetical protein
VKTEVLIDEKHKLETEIEFCTMAKSKSIDKSVKKAAQTQKKKRDVQVVPCPMAFPISNKPSRKRSRDQKPERRDSNRGDKRSSKLLDWHDTAKEIRAYGATTFVGKQKRDYEDEKYFSLTGRHKKKPQTPLPILRGIKKAAAKREAKEREEARQAGIVLPKARKEDKMHDSTYRIHGPAPNIGFMKAGVFRVKKKER